MFRQLSLVMAVSCTLTSPVSAQNSDVDPRVIGSFLKVAMDFQIANAIAVQCNDIAMKRGAKRSMVKWGQKQRVKHGLSEGRLDKEIRKRDSDLIDLRAAFMKNYSVDPDNKVTICAAGKKNIASLTGVGNFLRLR